MPFTTTIKTTAQLPLIFSQSLASFAIFFRSNNSSAHDVETKQEITAEPSKQLSGTQGLIDLSLEILNKDTLLTSPKPLDSRFTNKIFWSLGVTSIAAVTATFIYRLYQHAWGGFSVSGLSDVWKTRMLSISKHHVYQPGSL